MAATTMSTLTSATSTPEASTFNSHLSYPTPTPRAPTPPPAAPRELHKSRLYVGNLHPTVDEYTLLQAFSKFGKISKMDYLFHKTGPSKGKPRGYAFVEYSDQEDASRALASAHEKLLRGRKLVVTFAHQAPSTDTYSGTGAGSKNSFRRKIMESNRPTTLSLIKSTSHTGKTEDKIAALEAKLHEMQEHDASSSLHPSLPRKPPPAHSIHNDARGTVKPGAPNKGAPGPRGSSGGAELGKKPTLDELMKGSHANGQGGLLKR